jgi:hypothetical protein
MEIAHLVRRQAIILSTHTRQTRILPERERSAKLNAALFPERP